MKSASLVNCNEPKSSDQRGGWQGEENLSQTKRSVYGVAEARDDEPFGIKVSIDGSSKNGNIGMVRAEIPDTLRRGEQVDHARPAGAAFTQEIHRGHGAAAGSQHRINEDDFMPTEVCRQALVVNRRPESPPRVSFR